MRGVKAQASVEYLLVVGMAFIILLPGAYLFYQFSQGSGDEIVSARITRAGTEIIYTVEAMYAVGQNSWSTIDIEFPSTVTNVYVSAPANELIIQYDTQNGRSEAVFFSPVNITGAGPGGNISLTGFQPGFTKVKVSSIAGSVEISELIR